MKHLVQLVRKLIHLWCHVPTNKVRPLTSDEEAARAHYRKRDREKVRYMKVNRQRNYEMWRVNYREAEHVLHQRKFRQMWNGIINQ